jgi:hypothetical protein
LGRHIPVIQGPPNPGVISVHPFEQSCHLHVIASRARSFILYDETPVRGPRHTMWEWLKAVLVLLCATAIFVGLFVSFVYVIYARYGEV